MAITASMAVSSATCKAEQSIAATVTVSNSGGSAVNVTGLVPLCSPAGTDLNSVSVALGQPPIGPGMTVSVAASGSTTFTWNVTPHAPQSGFGLAMPASQVYDIGATIYTSDGAITDATSTTLTVSNPSHT